MPPIFWVIGHRACSLGQSKSHMGLTNDFPLKYGLAGCQDIDLGHGIYVDVNSHSLNEGAKDKNTSNEVTKFTMRIKSKVKTTRELQQFVEACEKEYQSHLETINANKLYHFIYKGQTSGDKNQSPQMTFLSEVISDLTDPNGQSNETFDHLHNEHKAHIMDDITRLRDHQYYRAHGLKRKKGYLFYGKAGCGKTYTVTAMANFDNRHILEIPMSRVKTNAELEDLLNLKEINCIPIKKDKLIILFDEIDCGNKAVNKREGEANIENNKASPDKDPSPSNPKDTSEIMADSILSLMTSSVERDKRDSLNLGTMLSRLDGVGNYDGLIIIATTNCKDKLSPALYRHGRLNPIYFDCARKADIRAMIEQSYDRKLTTKEANQLPDREHGLSPASIRKFIEDNDGELGPLLKFLNNQKSKGS